jgi:hypothetical protein
LMARYSAKAFASLTVRNRRPSRFLLDPFCSPCPRLRFDDMRPPAARNCDPNPPLPPHIRIDRRSERKSSCGFDKSVETGAGDSTSCLFEIVVRINLESSFATKRSKIRSCSCETGVDAGTGKESVDGRFRPGKVESRTLIVGTAMLREIFVAAHYDTLASFLQDLGAGKFKMFVVCVTDDVA